MHTLWTHAVPFVLFWALGVAFIGHGVRRALAWRKTGVWRIQNRLTWMPGGPLLWTASDLASREDRLKDRKVYEVKNAVGVLLLFVVCFGIGLFALFGAIEFLRFGQGFVSTTTVN